MLHQPDQCSKIHHNGIRIRCGPRNSDPLLASSASISTENIKNRNKTKLNNCISVAQWNLCGLSHMGKVNIVNSITCDIITFQEINHPVDDLTNHIHQVLIDKRREKMAEEVEL